MKLLDKISVITGARRGLGFATAKLFFDQGAKVIALDLLDLDRGIYADAFGNSDRVIFKRVDITKPNEVRELASEISEKFGRVDVLVNNAAVHTVGNIEEMSEEDFRRTMEVNVLGLFYVTKSLIGLMKNNPNGGSIINVASNLGLVGAAGRIAYPTTKAAVINFTRCMALDYAKENVRVNAIAPGAIRTEMTIDFYRQMGSEDLAERDRAMHPLGRLAEPEEIARGILFLACDDSSYATGSVLAVDGGYTCGK